MPRQAKTAQASKLELYGAQFNSLFTLVYHPLSSRYNAQIHAMAQPGKGISRTTGDVVIAVSS
ncbi:hypothetical protein EPA93_27810 [Ktedonosporobacter rubrisoli]|uniref:Uncharacterized protein n=1 Tax=Ktedonosporobacter rubrisoli TaxID=2509675 RepID=A0A4P6JVA3_KTERU|nr:hypothetical protein [Ktedonosporobacter rubrisoli]QBD79577.1 hypothetical protein EPA93_27810 [Ktedonosporobacter rubrisoli]